ncbi:MAG TPA: hypothetical protein VFX49_11785 [Chloroflexota bacterium]|nr:hypothetical protein [Chloroflexota bacterium]
MARAQMQQEILNIVAGTGGGALAGYLETRFPEKKALGLSMGALVAIGGIGIDLANVGPSRVQHYAGEIGAGAAAYVVGRIVAEKTAKQQSSSTQTAALRSGVRGVGALPAGRNVVTAEQLQRSLAQLGHAA